MNTMSSWDFDPKSIQVVPLLKKLKQEAAVKMKNSPRSDGAGANDKNSYDVKEEDNVGGKKNVENFKNSDFLPI